MASQFLGRDKDGFFLAEVDTNGQLQNRRDLTAVDALKWLDQRIDQYGTRNLPAFDPKSGRSEGTLDSAGIEGTLTQLIERIATESGGNLASLRASLRAAIQSPETLHFLKESPGVSEEVLRTVWPDLDQRIAGRPDPEGLSNGDVLGGASRQGRGPLPDRSNGQGDGRPSPGAGGGSVQDATRAGDPILPFSGQLLIEHRDLEVEGVGIDLCFERVYLHDTEYFGPLGSHWDHSYNLWLREDVVPSLSGGYEHVVMRSTGRLRADRFVAVKLLADLDSGLVPNDAEFRAPDGSHDVLTKVNGLFVLLSPDGRNVYYNELLRADRFSDGNGNEVRFEYEQDPTRLTAIVDTCGRRFELDYNEGGLCIGVRDLVGDRSFQYAFDDQQRLVAVVHETHVPEHPTRIQRYRYWGEEAPPGLDANIVGIIDARGVEVLQVAYGTQPELASFNRVVEQRDGGITRFEYDFLFEPSENPADPEAGAAAVRVQMLGPTGDAHELVYSGLGRLIRHAMQIVTPNGISDLETRWTYNLDGRVLREERPSGAIIEFTYGREVFERGGAGSPSATPDERAKFGELRRIVEHARPGSVGPPLRITEFDYDPKWALISEQRGPYFADWTEVPIGPIAPFARRFAYDGRGNVIRIEYPDVTQSDGSLQANRALYLDRDSRGRLVARRIPLDEGHELQTSYQYPLDASTNCSHASSEHLDPDQANLVRRFDVDGVGRLLAVVEASGLRVGRTLDALGRELREETSTDGAAADSEVRITQWSPHDRPVKVTWNRVDASGNEDPSRELIEEFGFDLEGDVRTHRLRAADGTIDRTSSFERGADGRCRRAHVDGVETSFQYDQRGLLVRRVSIADGAQPMEGTFRYDDDGLISEARDAEGRVEKFARDGFGRVRQRTHPSGTVEEYEWDPDDRLVRHRVWGRHPDFAGMHRFAEEAFDRDESGRVRRHSVAIFDPLDSLVPEQWANTSYVYDAADRVVRISTPDGEVISKTWDGLSRPKSVTSTSGLTENWFYNDLEHTVRHVVEATGTNVDGTSIKRATESTTTWDMRGNPIHRIDGLGNVERFEWDSRNFCTARTDAAGMRHERMPDAEGQLLGEVVAAGMPEALHWSIVRDQFGRLSGAIGPRGVASDVQRDGFGRPVSVRYGPADQFAPTTTKYDRAGRVFEQVDARGLKAVVTHDEEADALRVDFDRSGVSAGLDVLGPTTLKFAFDGAGRLVTASDDAVSVRRTYDSRGCLLSDETNGFRVSMTYSAGGSLKTLTYPAGRALQFVRDSAGRLLRVDETASGTAPLNSVATHPLFERRPLGAVSTVAEIWRQALTRRITSDRAGRILGVQESVGDGTVLLDLRQVSDAIGYPQVRQLRVGDDVQSDILSIDGQGRVTSVVRTSDTPPNLQASLQSAGSQHDHDLAAIAAAASAIGPEIAFSYVLDNDGARRSDTVANAGGPPDQNEYVIGSSGEIAAVNGDPVTRDPSGAMTDLGSRHYAYDVFGRLARIDDAGHLTNVRRDPLGRICRFQSGIVEVDFIHHDAALLEVRTAGEAVAQFVRIPDDQSIIELDLPGKVLRPLSDHAGTTYAFVDRLGSISGQRNYDPFGRVLDGNAPNAFMFGFHGMLCIPDTELYLTAFRTYVSGEGGFLEPDPAGLVDGPNAYVFGRGNPYAHTDPLGLMSTPANGSTGRAGGQGRGTYGVGDGDGHELRWWERMSAAIGGATYSVMNTFTEPLLQVYDLFGLATQSLGISTGLYRYDHQVASGMGQLAARTKGIGDFYNHIGRSIIETPGRAWHAAERGAWFEFGGEALNTYSLGRSGLGALRGTSSIAFNRGVWALKYLGGRSTWLRVRNWQVSRLARYAQSGSKVVFDESLPTGRYGEFGRFYPGTGTIHIGESAFTPGIWGLWPGVGGSNAFRIRVGNLFRGNVARRTMVHEDWHAQQLAQDPSGFRASFSQPYKLDPTEFTQPFGTFVGAWNRELNTPAGPLSQGLGASSIALNSLH